jgi:hypothetical protein
LELKKKLAAREHQLAEALAREEATAEVLRTIANPTIDAELAPRLISLLRRANNHWRPTAIRTAAPRSAPHCFECNPIPGV